jgi:hypothetical protein
MTDLDLTNDIIDVRDIIARIEALESDIADLLEYLPAHVMVAQWVEYNDELQALLKIMVELETVGGGDEQWRGEWYPITLIADSYFTDYARELLEDCGDLPRELPHYIEIDWDATARNIRVDYTPVTINNFTYWTR